jgi:hypothetical protein
MHNSIFHDSQKMEATQVFADGWMKKQMQYIHTMENYSAFNRKEILTHGILWMILEEIMLRELS